MVLIFLFAIAFDKSAKLSTLAVCSSVAAVLTLFAFKASAESASPFKSLTFKGVVVFFLLVAFSSLAVSLASAFDIYS